MRNICVAVYIFGCFSCLKVDYFCLEITYKNMIQVKRVLYGVIRSITIIVINEAHKIFTNSILIYASGNHIKLTRPRVTLAT
jgi:hypothetical protein